MSKATELLDAAKKLAASAENLGGPVERPVRSPRRNLAKAYPTREQRAAFIHSNEYKEISALIDAAISRTGLVEGATPKKSGRFVVRLPQTLHAALEREAGREGVSLNQLVVVKLAVPLSRLYSAPPTRRDAPLGK